MGILMVLISCTKKINTVHYTILPIVENGKHLLKVKMLFEAEKEGETTLLFQNKAWGQDSLYNVIKDMKLLVGKATIVREKDSGWITIKHPKNLKTLEFEYKIRQDINGKLTSRNSYRPVIQPEYFHIFSHNFFMLPRAYAKTSDEPFNVSIDWEGFPKEYTIQNSFGSNEPHQFIEQTSERKFHNAIFMGGDFRVHTIYIHTNKIAFAIRGNWETFKDSTIITILKQTITTQRTLWKDHSQNYFSISIIPTEQEKGSSFQGTGLTNSFAMSASNNKYLETQGLVYLFNHELQHNWIGTAIKNDNEEEQYWFSEGFTEYYTIKNIAKNGIYNLDKSYFINELNGFTRALYVSPVKEAPNSDLTSETFWSDYNYQKLPYRRGALLAFYLDVMIKQNSKGTKTLDDLMLELKDNAISKGQKITHPYFIKTVNKYLKEDFKPFFDTHIEKGKLIDLSLFFTTIGFEFNPTAKVYSLGFTFTNDKKSIQSIDKTSNAYKAGLRKGDIFTYKNYYQDEIAYETMFKVLREGKEITIKYFPVKNAVIPQLKNSDYNKKLLF